PLQFLLFAGEGERACCIANVSANAILRANGCVEVKPRARDVADGKVRVEGGRDGAGRVAEVRGEEAERKILAGTHVVIGPKVMPVTGNLQAQMQDDGVCSCP